MSKLSSRGSERRLQVVLSVLFGEVSVGRAVRCERWFGGSSGSGVIRVHRLLEARNSLNSSSNKSIEVPCPWSL